MKRMTMIHSQMMKRLLWYDDLALLFHLFTMRACIYFDVLFFSRHLLDEAGYGLISINTYFLFHFH